MYLPKSFEDSDRAALVGFIRSHPLATIVTVTADGPCADHVPVLPYVEGDGLRLRCHVARANPIWRNIESHSKVLAIFHDAGGYISPSWYPSKAQTGRVVPTWNYSAVHATGTAHTRHDASWLRALVERLTAAFEDSRPAPWRVTDAPKDYIDAQLAGIVGLEIEVSSLIGKFKMSQNRLPRDIDGVVTGLREAGTDAAFKLADEILRRRPR